MALHCDADMVRTIVGARPIKFLPGPAGSKSAARKPSVPSLGERVLALATGRTRQELYRACPNDRPNHIGIAVQRHLRAGTDPGARRQVVRDIAGGVTA